MVSKQVNMTTVRVLLEERTSLLPPYTKFSRQLIPKTLKELQGKDSVGVTVKLRSRNSTDKQYNIVILSTFFQ